MMFGGKLPLNATDHLGLVLRTSISKFAIYLYWTMSYPHTDPNQSVYAKDLFSVNDHVSSPSSDGPERS